jgi:hypothetical protein
MATTTTLLQHLQAATFRKSIDKLADLICSQQFTLIDLLEFTCYTDNNIAFRACWLLETLILKHADKYTGHYSLMIAYGGRIKCHSCQRHYAKVYRHITDKKVIKNIQFELQDTDLEPVIEQCFDWLIDPKVKVAVKAFASQTLYNLADRRPWIAEELQHQLKTLMINGSPGIQSVGRRLLSTLTTG